MSLMTGYEHQSNYEIRMARYGAVDRPDVMTLEIVPKYSWALPVAIVGCSAAILAMILTSDQVPVVIRPYVAILGLLGVLVALVGGCWYALSGFGLLRPRSRVISRLAVRPRPGADWSCEWVAEATSKILNREPERTAELHDVLWAMAEPAPRAFGRRGDRLAAWGTRVRGAYLAFDRMANRPPSEVSS